MSPGPDPDRNRMNAPVAQRPDEAQAASGMQVFAFFHLNLAFSSIEEERRDEVIAVAIGPCCGWRNARSHRHGNFRLYAGRNRARDPAWIARAREPDRARPDRTDRFRLQPDDRAAGAGAGHGGKSAPGPRNL